MLSDEQGHQYRTMPFSTHFTQFSVMVSSSAGNMSAKRKWESFKKNMSNKRVHKAETGDDEECLAVQRLTASVEGKAQK